MLRSIILKKQDRGEADELVVFLSRDLGWLTGVAKNAKKSRVRFGGHLEALSLVDLTLRSRKKDDLVWIDEAQVVSGFLAIRSDIAKVARAAYFLELASIFLPEGHPDTALFDFLLEYLETLEQSDPPQICLLLDEIRLLGLLGYAPRFDLCPACGKPLGQGEEAIFSPSRGGACHLACLPIGEEGNLHLSPDTLAVLRRATQVEREAAKRLRINKKGVDELHLALSAFVRYTRGEEIKSLLFLEKLHL